jgi:hypothetical protein
MTCIAVLFIWLEKNPEYVLQLLRPGDVEGLFGKTYKDLASPVAQAQYALPVLRALTEHWMAGKPLCDLELAAGTDPRTLKTCEVARHFVVRVVSDIAFVAGLPGRILAARPATEMTEPVSLVIATLPGAVRRGCNSPEALANAVYLGVNTSRVAAHNEFISVRAHLQDGAVDEPFEATIDRVVKAHLMAGLGDLTKDYDDDDDDDVGVEGEGPERYLEEHECGLCNGTGNGSGINPYSGEPMRCHGCEGEGKIRYWVLASPAQVLAAEADAILL